MITNEMFIVIGKNDEGEYELMMRTAWDDRATAERYARAIAWERMAMVIRCPRGVEFRFMVKRP